MMNFITSYREVSMDRSGSMDSRQVACSRSFQYSQHFLKTDMDTVKKASRCLTQQMALCRGMTYTTFRYQLQTENMMADGLSQTETIHHAWPELISKLSRPLKFLNFPTAVEITHLHTSLKTRSM